MKALEEYIKQSEEEFDKNFEEIYGDKWIADEDDGLHHLWEVKSWHTSQLQGLIKLLVDEMEKRKKEVLFKRGTKNGVKLSEQFNGNDEWVVEVQEGYNQAIDDLQQELKKLTTE